MGWNGRISLRVNEKDAITIKLLADDTININIEKPDYSDEDDEPVVPDTP